MLIIFFNAHAYYQKNRLALKYIRCHSNCNFIKQSLQIHSVRSLISLMVSVGALDSSCCIPLVCNVHIWRSVHTLVTWLWKERVEDCLQHRGQDIHMWCLSRVTMMSGIRVRFSAITPLFPQQEWSPNSSSESELSKHLSIGNSPSGLLPRAKRCARRSPLVCVCQIVFLHCVGTKKETPRGLGSGCRRRASHSFRDFWKAGDLFLFWKTSAGCSSNFRFSWFKKVSATFKNMRSQWSVNRSASWRKKVWILSLSSSETLVRTPARFCLKQ